MKMVDEQKTHATHLVYLVCQYERYRIPTYLGILYMTGPLGKELCR
jgi:hypothetical protein